MKIIFRVDASNRIGTGHLVRCRTLGEALRSRGVDVRFVCRAHTGHMVESLRRQAFPVAVLPPPPEASDSDDDYESWLGVSQNLDAKETQAALHGDRPDWLVVDHYGLDAQWERTMRPHTRWLMVIDDLANRLHDCDVLLDQNYAPNIEHRYQGLVPASCQMLLGLRYALLRPEYEANSLILPHRDGRIRRVLVFFGGVDPTNMTGLALNALSTLELAQLEVDVVIGANNPHRETIAEQVARRHGTRLHGPRPHLADLMISVDLALGAGGTTTWERLCLGLPSLVISIASNQRDTCRSLHEAGLIIYLGDPAKVNEQSIQRTIRRMNYSKICSKLATTGQEMVDGKGAKRVTENMLILAYRGNQWV